MKYAADADISRINTEITLKIGLKLTSVSNRLVRAKITRKKLINSIGSCLKEVASDMPRQNEKLPNIVIKIDISRVIFQVDRLSLRFI
jgi:ADP-dependent phosphofructokinase/glucokinase